MPQFLTLIFMSIIVEGLITYAKTFFVGGKQQWQMLVGIAMGILVALVYNVDIFALLGITAQVPYVGAILTGVLISRGSNYIFDLMKALQSANGGTFAAVSNKAQDDFNTVEPIVESTPVANLEADSMAK
ncbi:hypothetical protein [Caproiciproducens sp.]|uniref:hypothetical protein n=1 Tax=Caproiciproducens sp. TaxID=1954376 RepID=UPI0028A1AC62|nr:hypothetical protein [Caproiciproducens sp.]